jgi:hypothetical protein
VLGEPSSDRGTFVNLAVGDANRINHELARDGALEGIGTLHAGALALGGRAIIVSRGAARAAYTAATAAAAAATASAAKAEDFVVLRSAWLPLTADHEKGGVALRRSFDEEG